jgi:hypothetical protein
MAPNAGSSAIKTVCFHPHAYCWNVSLIVDLCAQLIRVTAFGLGASYGGHRLAYLKQKKKEEDEERARHEFHERVEKAIEERERAKEAASSMYYSSIV